MQCKRRAQNAWRIGTCELLLRCECQQDGPRSGMRATQGDESACQIAPMHVAQVHKARLLSPGRWLKAPQDGLVAVKVPCLEQPCNEYQELCRWPCGVGTHRGVF